MQRNTHKLITVGEWEQDFLYDIHIERALLPNLGTVTARGRLQFAKFSVGEFIQTLAIWHHEFLNWITSAKSKWFSDYKKNEFWSKIIQI